MLQVPVEVASFLLNEKRTEITKIELKQRISVLLVPNKTLETPNYKLERLKHDDPRLDNIEASYKMAEEMGFHIIDASASIEAQQKQMREIVMAQLGEATQLSNVRFVGDGYPLRGTVGVSGTAFGAPVAVSAGPPRGDG